MHDPKQGGVEKAIGLSVTLGREAGQSLGGGNACKDMASYGVRSRSSGRQYGASEVNSEMSMRIFIDAATSTLEPPAEI